MATLTDWVGRDKQAQNRYLKLMQGKQALVDREYQQQMAEEAKAKADQEAMQPGEYAVKGAELGMTASGGNPWGALIGGVLGKGLGSYQAGKNAGGSTANQIGAGLGTFLSPLPEARYLASGAGMQHGANVAGGFGRAASTSKARREAAERQLSDDSGFHAETEAQDENARFNMAEKRRRRRAQQALGEE